MSKENLRATISGMKISNETIPLRKIAKIMYVKSGVREINSARIQSGCVLKKAGTPKKRMKLNAVSERILMVLNIANLYALF